MRQALHNALNSRRMALCPIPSTDSDNCYQPRVVSRHEGFLGLARAVLRVVVGGIQSGSPTPSASKNACANLRVASGAGRAAFEFTGARNSVAKCWSLRADSTAEAKPVAESQLGPGYGIRRETGITFGEHQQHAANACPLGSHWPGGPRSLQRTGPGPGNTIPR